MDGDLQRRLGRNLRALRETDGQTQQAFAEKLKVHRTYLGALERGRRNVTLQTIERLADRLETDALDLLVGSAP